MNLDKVMSSLAGSGVLGGLAGGAVGGALISSKKARKTAGTALKVGGLAALGGMAWKAYQGYQSQQAETAPAPAAAPAGQARPARAIDTAVWSNLESGAFDVDPTDGTPDSRALLIIKAMIAAACADGHLDSDERHRIMQQVSAASLAAEEKALVIDAMQNPPTQNQLCEGVDCPELAAEMYMASALAVDSRRLEAELYLDALAYRLGIPEGLVEQMHQQLPGETSAAA